MTRNYYLRIAFAFFLCIIGGESYAYYRENNYDIAVKNDDGVTLYYYYINDGKELEVTYYGADYYEGYTDWVYRYRGICATVINIPESVTYMNRTRKVTRIGPHAFHYEIGYPNTTTKIVTIPNSVTSIGAGAFAGCKSLTSITIPDSVRYIGPEAFSGCGLTSITIPNSVTSIGNDIFYNCNDLESVTIGDGLTHIPANSFRDLKQLKSITLGKGVNSIGEGAFYHCSGLNYVGINDLGAWCNIDFECSDPYDGRFVFSNPLIYAHNLYLNSNKLTNIVIPDTVSIIKNYAFFGCTSLVSVTIPSSVTKIGDIAFKNCTGLKSVNIRNNVTSIGNYVFYGCANLETLTLPESIDSIGHCAFEDCNSLNSVHISDIGAWCNIVFSSRRSDSGQLYTNNPLKYAQNLFLNDEKITNLVIPEGVHEIKDAVFYCCPVKSVSIPNSVTKIGDYAFRQADLSSLTIGNGMTDFGKYAFSGCSQLYTIISLTESPSPLINDNCFDNDHFMNSSLYVPVGTIDKYKSTEGWKKFVWMEEGIPTSIQEEKVSNDDISWYSLDGLKLESAKKGINIIRHANGKTSKILIK